MNNVKDDTNKCLTCTFDSCIGADNELCPIHDIYLEEKQKAKRREYGRRYYYRNHEKALAYAKEYRKRNKEKCRLYYKQYYSEHRVELCKKQKERDRKLKEI